MAIHRYPSGVEPVTGAEPGATVLRFLNDVLRGLTRPRKALPCKYLYDQRGSELFDRICELPEYYPTRTERAIMRGHAADMAELLGRDCVVVEYGSGSSQKTRLLLNRLRGSVAYVPVDISQEHLMIASAALAAAYPRLDVYPIVADFTRRFPLPAALDRSRRRIVYFPGSTIGNFAPAAAVRLLRNMARLVGPDGGLLIGVDLHKDRAVLEPAYDDAQGVTAAFNRNLLDRINRELQSDFRSERFAHRAVYRQRYSRMEMHLVSRVPQRVQVGGVTIRFRRHESIHTENSYKYTLPGFALLAARAGLSVQRVWTDDRQWFSVQYLTISAPVIQTTVTM